MAQMKTKSSNLLHFMGTPCYSPRSVYLKGSPFSLLLNIQSIITPPYHIVPRHIVSRHIFSSLAFRSFHHFLLLFLCLLPFAASSLLLVLNYSFLLRLRVFHSVVVAAAIAADAAV